MTLEFFGTGRHKVPVETLFETKGAVFLDVRSRAEQLSLDLPLEHHVAVVRIPTDEIPDRVDEIPRDTLVGVFCSAGTRASIVYAYLRTKGYTEVRIVHGGYEEVVEAVKPAKLWKHMRQEKLPE
jgi:rhodanese-related sulfurtransferase